MYTIFFVFSINSLIKQAKKMVPKKKFGCVFSGGIDSSLQSAIINKIKKPNILATLHHEGKDEITKYINNFQKFFCLESNDSFFEEFLQF